MWDYNEAFVYTQTHIRGVQIQQNLSDVSQPELSSHPQFLVMLGGIRQFNVKSDLTGPEN